MPKILMTMARGLINLHAVQSSLPRSVYLVFQPALRVVATISKSNERVANIIPQHRTPECSPLGTKGTISMSFAEQSEMLPKNNTDN